MLGRGRIIQSPSQQAKGEKVDVAGNVVDVFAHTGSRGSQVVAKLLLHDALPDSVLRHLAGQVTGCDLVIRTSDGYIKLRAQTPISNEHASVMAESFLALVADYIITRARASKVVSIDRGRQYRNKPSGLR